MKIYLQLPLLEIFEVNKLLKLKKILRVVCSLWLEVVLFKIKKKKPKKTKAASRVAQLNLS